MKNGLLSAIVATFLLLSLPQLSPDPGSQTVALLTQFVNASAETHVVVQNTPFKPPASIVRVNVMWTLSLILSLCSALLATSMQQWARGYLDYAQRGPPQKQALIRRYLFEGVEKYQLQRAFGVVPLLLHVSVFLFFAGLVEFLFPINAVVAHSALDCILVFAFIYVISTLLPIFRPDCPYRTPLSGFTYTSFEFFASGFFWAALALATAIEGIVHRFLEICGCSCSGLGTPDGWLTKWKAVLKDKALTHYKQYLHGLLCRVELAAMEAASSIGASALRGTLNTLHEDKKCEDFAAVMPGFFESHEPKTTSAMLSLMSDQSTSDPILGSRLRDLLGTCLHHTSLLVEEQRKCRLRVCLTSLWYCARAYNLPENSGMPLAPYLRTIFTGSELISSIQTEEDRCIRLLGRCFWSLIVKKLANDIASRSHTAAPATTEEIACLSRILGATGGQVKHWLGRIGAVDLANIVHLASGEFETVITSRTDWDKGERTLNILLEGMLLSHSNVEWDHLPLAQVAQFRVIHSKFANAHIPYMLKEKLQCIAERMPSTSSVEEPEMIFSPEMALETGPSLG